VNLKGFEEAVFLISLLLIQTLAYMSGLNTHLVVESAQDNKWRMTLFPLLKRGFTAGSWAIPLLKGVTGHLHQSSASKASKLHVGGIVWVVRMP